MPVAQFCEDENAGESSKTFMIKNEGHTLGNALKSIISSYPDVEFCGYTVPHPMENNMYFRIQMKKGKAIDALRKGLLDLSELCDHTINIFQKEVSDFNAEHNVS